MKTNYLLWMFLTGFYALVTAGYALWWFLTYGGWEPIGTAALAMLTFMSAFLGPSLDSSRLGAGGHFISVSPAHLFLLLLQSDGG